MHCRILSDLHIEYYPFTIPPLEHDSETILILAGDIGSTRHKPELSSFLTEAAHRFRAVIYVLGNHEFYDAYWPGALADIKSWVLPSNLHLLERETVEVDGFTFVGATLWADFEQGNDESMAHSEHFVRDFSVIHRDIDPSNPDQRPFFLPEHALADHLRSRTWLRDTLSSLHTRGKKSVLITHHGLTPRSIHERFQGNAVNGAFISDLTDLIEDTQPVLAIHGHVHDSFDYVVGETHVVVNPRGYARRPGTQENKAFNPCLVIEI